MRVRPDWGVSAVPVGMPELRWLDVSACAEHVLLEGRDRCAYLTEYRPGTDGAARQLRQLMWQFKCSPSSARADARLAGNKRRAICTMAGWLRGALAREAAESWTWVPVPPSRHREDPDFDDRLAMTLALAFDGYDLDQRALLRLAASSVADHRSQRRLPEESLYALLQVDERVLSGVQLRAGIALFDDVLTSGKHYRCCTRRLTERLPGVPVHGVFLMRRLSKRSARALGQAW